MKEIKQKTKLWVNNSKLCEQNVSLIMNLPTTRTGLNPAKRCKWCYNIMQRPPRQKRDAYFMGRRRDDPLKQAFCCLDCRQEHLDWSIFVQKKTIEDRRKLRQERKRIIKCMKQQKQEN